MHESTAGPLRDIDRIAKPVVVPGQLSTNRDPKLPTCNAQALADTLDVQGQVFVSGNLPDACGG